MKDVSVQPPTERTIRIWTLLTEAHVSIEDIAALIDVTPERVRQIAYRESRRNGVKIETVTRRYLRTVDG